MKNFFDNKNLVILVDRLAKRYGKLPHEVLKSMVWDFNLSMAVMMLAEKNEVSPTPGNKTKWNNFGINRTVKKKGK